MNSHGTIINVSGGRRLCVELNGDPAGRPVLVQMGTPNSRLMYEPWVEDAKRRGIHLISYDRPGYGGSTPQPDRTVADCVDDVRAIAEHLGADRIATWGISGGGPHALACAALLPDLVCAVGSLASVAPYGGEGLDYFTGMGQDNVDDMKLYLSDRKAARAKTRKDQEELIRVTPEEIGASFASLLSPVDEAVATNELAVYLAQSMKAGLAPGDEGWWEDGVAHMEPWGFSFSDIRVPVQLWHGAQDRFVPVQHGEWLAKQIPGVDAHINETDGHLTLFNRVPEVHEWLLEHF